MNKIEFKEKLKSKQFNYCIEILRKEIIDILVKKIKEIDSYFVYSTTNDLYNKSKKILERKYVIIAYKLYNFDIIDEKEEYILDEMLIMYEDLNS